MTCSFPPRPGSKPRTTFHVEPSISRQIVKGGDCQVRILLYAESGRPYDATGFTGATGFFRGVTGQVAVPGTCSPPELGEVVFALPIVESDKLQAGEEQDWEAVIDDANGRQIVQFPASLTVYDRLILETTEE